jgi:hypothetical protein
MFKKMCVIVMVLGMLAMFVGCTDAEKSRIMAYGNQFEVTLYSGGTAVAKWTSSGKVLNEEKSDGYYFNDLKTGKLVRVSGTLSVVEK